MRLFAILLFAAAAFAQSPESAVLGGPCEAEPGDDVVRNRAWHGFVNKALQAERRGDYAAAAEAARDVVRHRCSNEHWRLKLAELETQAGREQQAIAVLETAYGRFANAMVRRLADPESPLHALSQSASFRNSALARTLTEARVALERRRAEARTRLAAMPRGRRVENYVARDACPGECCMYGTWAALEDVILYSSPGGFSEAARIAKGSRVEALTGEVRLTAIPAQVRFGDLAEEGEIVFLLDYTGEGHGRISVNGKLADGHVLSVHEHCPFPGADCWAEVVNPEDAGRQRDHDWWVKVQTPDGLTGWTDEVEKFER